MNRLLELKYRDTSRRVDYSGKLEIKNATEESADLYFYGDIVSAEWLKWDDADKAPQDIVDFLKEVEGVKNLNMYINCAGGEVFAGIAIHNILERNQAYKKAHVDGLSASIATVIMFAADEVIVPTNAQIMIHKPWTIALGNAFDFRKLAEELDLAEDNILTIYEKHLKEGVDINTVKELVSAETWMTGDKAAEIFNIKTEDKQQLAACASGFFSMYRNTPKAFIKPPGSAAKDETDDSQKQTSAKGPDKTIMTEADRLKAEIELLNLK